MYSPLTFPFPSSRSTSIFVLNLSDLKPCLMTAAAALAFVYDPRPYFVGGGMTGVPNRTDDAAEQSFLTNWTAQYYDDTQADTHAHQQAKEEDTEEEGTGGKTVAAMEVVAQTGGGGGAPVLGSIAALWTRYFNISWVQGGASDEMLGGMIGGIANAVAVDLARNFSITAATVQQADRGAKVASQGMDDAVAIHADAAALLPSVPADRQQFFKSHLLVQSAMQRFAIQAISHLANATYALVNGAAVNGGGRPTLTLFPPLPSTPSPAAVKEAAAHVTLALNAMDAMFAAQRAAEGVGEWHGMYVEEVIILFSAVVTYVH